MKIQKLMKFLGIILSLILLINIIPSNVFAKESGRNITDTELVSWDISPAGGTIKEGDRIEVSVSWEDTADMSIQK